MYMHSPVCVSVCVCICVALIQLTRLRNHGYRPVPDTSASSSGSGSGTAEGSLMSVKLAEDEKLFVLSSQAGEKGVFVCLLASLFI